MTPFGNAQIDTAQSKFGGASGLFDGTGDYLTTPDSADWDFGSSAFTIDFWVRFNDISNPRSFVSQGVDSNNEWYCEYLSGSNLVRFDYYAGGTAAMSWTAPFSPSTNTWYHVAIVRSGNTWYCFIDGVSQTVTLGLGSFSISMPNLSDVLTIGGSRSGTVHLMDGWLEEVRISKGVARWTANFTPPAFAYSP